MEFSQGSGNRLPINLFSDEFSHIDTISMGPGRGPTDVVDAPAPAR